MSHIRPTGVSYIRLGVVRGVGSGLRLPWARLVNHGKAETINTVRHENLRGKGLGKVLPKAIEKVHEKSIVRRRAQRLAEAVATALPSDVRTVLDVGAGDGQIAWLLLDRRPELIVEGIDILVRPNTAIPVTAYGGEHIPFGDDTFDAAVLIDVLHHTGDVVAILREVARVARQAIVVKDHTCDGRLARPKLRFMDLVGNARHGVSLPYNYLSTQQWRQVIAEAGLQVVAWRTSIDLYPAPFKPLFERRLHMVGVLTSLR